jgi:hypothetical protein
LISEFSSSEGGDEEPNAQSQICEAPNTGIESVRFAEECWMVELRAVISQADIRKRVDEGNGDANSLGKVENIR